jgi:drug/metabolite transporter (DMT)-like permease
MAVGVCAYALSFILARRVNRDQTIHSATVTAVSMAIGAIVLLALNGGHFYFRFTPAVWALIGLSAIACTALAFTVWNHTLRLLPAIESSMISSTMLIPTTVLAILLIGERLPLFELIGILLVGSGALIVLLRR